MTLQRLTGGKSTTQVMLVFTGLALDHTASLHPSSILNPQSHALSGCRGDVRDADDDSVASVVYRRHVGGGQLVSLGLSTA